MPEPARTDTTTWVTCPLCGRRFEHSESQALPFCSNRCRTVDLGRWLNEEQGLPCDAAEEAPE